VDFLKEGKKKKKTKGMFQKPFILSRKNQVTFAQ
jgi:hypothetical protein